jgi:hypothetical protein
MRPRKRIEGARKLEGDDRAARSSASSHDPNSSRTTLQAGDHRQDGHPPSSEPLWRRVLDAVLAGLPW